MDRQGQVHAFQDSQNTGLRLEEQETNSLPGQTQAVLAFASGSRILIVDADWQAWTWDAGKTGQAKPARIEQDPGMRTFQAQSFSRGFLLLDSKGTALVSGQQHNQP